MGGAWEDARLSAVPPSRGMMGQYGDRRLGVPLITEILRHNGLAATFFVEPFGEEQGYPGQAEPVATHLLEHGQDIQLHVHPCYRYFALHQQSLPCPLTDDMADLTAQQQTDLLSAGCERLLRWTGKRPVAFRAGNMAASEQTLPHLADAGIRIDSSYCFPFAGGQCRFKADDPYNGSKWYNQVLEVALSGFYQPSAPGLHPAKPLDLVGVSFEECREAVGRINQAGADAVLILHSFSLFKVRNVQYDGGRLNRVVARRFRRLCQWLARRANDLPVRTFSQLAEVISRDDYTARAVAPCRLGRPLRALTRKAVQAVNRLYWV